MSKSEQIIVMLTIAFTLVELGSLALLIEVTVQGVPAFWKAPLLVTICLPVLFGWSIGRKKIGMTMAFLSVGFLYCLSYFLWQYGYRLFFGNALIIGLPAVVAIALLLIALVMKRHWPTRSAA